MNKSTCLSLLCMGSIAMLALANCKKNSRQELPATATLQTYELDTRPVINFTFTNLKGARNSSLETSISLAKTTNGRIANNTAALRSVVGCSGYLDGSWASSGYYTYATDTIRLDTVATSTTINISLNAYDVPNRFSVVSLCGGGTVASSSWMGYASYAGPWGMSLNTSATGTLYFTRGSCGLYEFKVETVVDGNNDAWSASFSCTP